MAGMQLAHILPLALNWGVGDWLRGLIAPLVDQMFRHLFTFVRQSEVSQRV